MGRAPCCDKANVKKGPWSPEEDATLKDYIEKFGTGGNWITLPQKIGIKRCGKSCRLRWLNYLRPDIKHGGFSEEEDNIICSLYISIGSRWSIIAAQLPGRTDNDIKNYWNTRLKKKLLGRRKQSQASRLTGSPEDPKEGNGMETLSNSAIERLQLHMQLQGLQNPNNMSMWPCKLNPVQEKFMQSLQVLNESSNPLLMQHVLHDEPFNNHVQQVYSSYSPSSNMLGSQMDSFVNVDVGSSAYVSGPDCVNQTSKGFQQYMAIQGEINQILSNKRANANKLCDALPGQWENYLMILKESKQLDELTPNELSVDQAQANEFACFKDMDSAKDMMTWWSSEFESNSVSSNSWDSNSVLDHHQQLEMKY